jgi:predicted ATPase
VTTLKLAKIRYVNDPGTPAAWELDPLNFGRINLLVGRNATGKTRVLSVMKRLASLLSNSCRLENADALWEVDWANGQSVEYLLREQRSRVVEERLIIDGQVRLNRGIGGVGTIWAERIGSDLDFQSPDTCLAVCSRQDRIQHSFLRPIETWARSVHSYLFTSIGRTGSSDSLIEILASARDHPGFLEGIKKDIEKLGYEIEEIGLRETAPAQSGPGNSLELFVKEKRLKAITRQNAMSQGMFRSLALLIYLNQLQLVSEPACILIDDFGEGLDFERVSALTDLTVGKCGDSGFQLILSTNDRVVMNKIPLEFWSVLRQEDGRTRILNQSNAPEVFENFKFTGLSNFDFFSMDSSGEQMHG